MSNDPTSLPRPASVGTAAVQAAPETRLAASRLAMRVAMLPDRPGSPPRSKALIDRLGLATPVQTLVANPVVATLRDTVEQWWRTHPWRPFVLVGVEAAGQAMVPIARKHPMRVVGVAMLGGAVLSRWTPWKWILASTVPTVAVSMLPTLLSRVATRLPLSLLLKLVGSPPARPKDARAVVPAVATRPVESLRPR